jgi:O-antigen/teichoic acid export membrane protein
LRSILNDALYRGSLTLLVNMAATSAIGFVFWTLAARTYPASTVGVFSGVTSGVSLLAAIAALGLPNTMIRHVVGAENPRELVIVAVTAIATVGTALCLVAVLVLGPHLPPALHLQQRGSMMLLVTALVGVTAVSNTLDAGLVATRSSHAVLIKNLVGSTVKVVALLLMVSFRSSGLLIAYGLGLVLATVVSGAALGHQLRGKGARFRSFLMLRGYLSFTSGNYLATIMGILPLSVVPLEVLVVRGAAETARFAVAFLIVGFLNLIPATVAQVLFAEASRQGVYLGTQLRKALRGVYGLLLPALVITVAAAPLLLRLFGAAYAAAATGCLRVLALSTLLTGGTYLVDSLLIARDRTAAYVFMNGANAALVLGCVGALLPRGLTAAAGGWALGQGLSLVLGLLVLAMGRAGRHRPRVRPAPTAKVPQLPADLATRPVIPDFDPQIRELLATWPMMPTTLIAERIGWDHSVQILLDRVTELRSVYSLPPHNRSRTSYLVGETAQCGLWFPPIEVPVGFGQTRSPQQLPVLTMITGYSRWLSAMLIPSRNAGDLFAGLWQLLSTLGAVPRALTWDGEGAIGRWEAGRVKLTEECSEFSHALGTKTIIGRSADPDTRWLVERSHAYLERSFLSGRSYASPMDFNAQLRDWLDTTNTRRRQPPNCSPVELIRADRQSMLPLPPVPPSTGWHLSMNVGNRPFLRFDSNEYSVHPSAIGRRVKFVADLTEIRVLCDGKVTASHDRAWARELTISDPAHVAAANMAPRHESRTLARNQDNFL